MSATQSVQTFGKKKTATAVALAKVRCWSSRGGFGGRQARVLLERNAVHGGTAQLTRFVGTQEGKGLIKINGVPLSLYGTPVLRGKVYEPVLILQSFVSSTTSLPSPLSRMDIRLRVSGGGHTSQLYALRQAIAKAVVAYVAKYEDAASALEIRKALVAYDRNLLVADPRRCEPKKFGGRYDLSRPSPSQNSVADSFPRVRSQWCPRTLPEVVRTRSSSAPDPFHSLCFSRALPLHSYR